MGAVVGGAGGGGAGKRTIVPRINPLRNCPDNEVLAYAKFNRLGFYPKKCPNAVDAFHATVKDTIDDIEENHPGSKFQLLKSADNIISIMREYCRVDDMKPCKKCGEPASGAVCRICEVVENLAYIR